MASTLVTTSSIPDAELYAEKYSDLFINNHIYLPTQQCVVCCTFVKLIVNSPNLAKCALVPMNPLRRHRYASRLNLNLLFPWPSGADGDGKGCVRFMFVDVCKKFGGSGGDGSVSLVLGDGHGYKRICD